MKKKVTLIVVAVLLIISLIVGISYAYWRHTFVATNVNKIVSSCFNMEITNEKNSITLDDAYPITDEKGRALTPYSFTITNTCDLFASYTVNLEMLEGTTLNSKYIKTMINNEAITNLNTLENTDPSIEGATESRILFKGSLGSGDSVDYTFRLWMDYDTPNNEDSMNKSFQGKITVTGEVSTYSPVENGFTNLADALLVNEYQTTNVDVAKNRISSKQEVDFSKTAPTIVWEEILKNTGTLTVVKANPSLIGSYGVVEKATKILFGRSYSFNENTGYYTLLSTGYYDPNTMDLEDGNYYYCHSSTSATSYDTVTYNDNTECMTMKKITKLSSVSNSSMTLNPSGTKIDMISYKFEVENMSANSIESDKSDKGLYEAIDDYGTTYYYRGNVTNNYIKFANFYWQVIRINGDGTVRMIYNGDNTTTTIASKPYNSSRYNPAYAGYMYGTVLNSSYLENITNTTSGALKQRIDSWYETNILNKGYSSYLADSGFCNDRSIATGDGYSTNKSTEYKSISRANTYSPTYICENEKSDLFTLAGNEKGNGALTYPIATITLDEALYAGYARRSKNPLNYLKINGYFWTMTPNQYFHGDSAVYSWYIGENGTVSTLHVSNPAGIRPVINLKADTEITGGIGTKNDPFIIK